MYVKWQRLGIINFANTFWIWVGMHFLNNWNSNVWKKQNKIVLSIGFFDYFGTSQFMASSSADMLDECYSVWPEYMQK